MNEHIGPSHQRVPSLIMRGNGQIKQIIIVPLTPNVPSHHSQYQRNLSEICLISQSFNHQLPSENLPGVKTIACRMLPKDLASLMAQTVKNLPAMQETQVQSLDQEDPLEKGMAIHSSILA